MNEWMNEYFKGFITKRAPKRLKAGRSLKPAANGRYTMCNGCTQAPSAACSEWQKYVCPSVIVFMRRSVVLTSAAGERMFSLTHGVIVVAVVVCCCCCCCWCCCYVPFRGGVQVTLIFFFFFLNFFLFFFFFEFFREAEFVFGLFIYWGGGVLLCVCVCVCVCVCARARHLLLFGKKDRQENSRKESERVHRPREAEIETDERTETGRERHTHTHTHTHTQNDREWGRWRDRDWPAVELTLVGVGFPVRPTDGHVDQRTGTRLFSGFALPFVSQAHAATHQQQFCYQTLVSYYIMSELSCQKYCIISCQNYPIISC